MNLERSIANFEKKLNRVDPIIGTRNKTGLNSWKGRQIIPLDDWIEIRDTPYKLGCFPDDFDQTLTFMSGDEVVTQREQEDLRKWDSDYQELMEYTENSNYGRFKCFHCLLSPDGDDPIFIGINRLVAKGLIGEEDGTGPIQYPCQVVNRFQCPYEKSNIKEENEEGCTKSNINVDDLFRLQSMAFLVEIALAVARKEDSKIQIRDKQDLLHAVTDNDTFVKILQQADDSHNSPKYRGITAGEDDNPIADYFMRLKNCLNLGELRFY